MTFDPVLLKSLTKGMLSFVPGSTRFPRREGGGANSARYCYSVWLRHLVLAHHNGMGMMPGVVSELGPGDSLGIGIAALLSGAVSYHALDTVRFIRSGRNEQILAELVNLFRNCAPVPDDREFPHLFPKLQDYSFPDRVIDRDVLSKSLSRRRVSAIREALNHSSLQDGKTGLITYAAPWDSASVVQENHVDFILSQAVLEHVDDLDAAYSSMFRWLKPGGFISSEIDFKSHGTAREWSGHWRYNDFLWRLIRGRRAYFLNREPLSTHLYHLRATGFELRFLSTVQEPLQTSPELLASRFSGMDAADLTTSSAYLLASKNNCL